MCDKPASSSAFAVWYLLAVQRTASAELFSSRRLPRSQSAHSDSNTCPVSGAIGQKASAESISSRSRGVQLSASRIRCTSIPAMVSGGKARVPRGDHMHARDPGQIANERKQHRLAFPAQVGRWIAGWAVPAQAAPGKILDNQNVQTSTTDRTLKLIPALDLKHGCVVHATGGDRKAYRPLCNTRFPSSSPGDVIRRLREQLRCDTFLHCRPRRHRRQR